MPKKAELEEEMNERLGTDIEWSRLRKDDLEHLRDGLEDEAFVKKVVAQFMNDKAGDKVEGQIEDWEPGMMLKLLGQLQNDEATVGDMLYGL